VLAAEEDLGGVVSMFDSIGALEAVVARFLCGGLDFAQLLANHGLDAGRGGLHGRV
jgi:hypothetical protein